MKKFSVALSALIISSLLVGCGMKKGDRGKTGPAGSTGADGQDGDFTGQLEVIDPCGDDPNHLDEVLLLINGEYYATYDSSYMIRLEPDNYVTEDNQRCAFSIDASGNYNE